jgi:hypothetical protein
MRQLRGAVALVAIAVLATSCPRPARPTDASAHPKLVVLIVIDQLPAWTFEKQKPLLTRGFARLLRDGVYWSRAEFPYAYTYTAPGHAAIATGAPPSVNGVLGNTWYRRGERLVRPAEYDPDAPIIYQPGTVPDGAFTPDDGASGKVLRVPGLSEALRLASPSSHSVAISLKARSACFLAGKRPDVVLWFEERVGGFTTSAAYRSSVPTWVTDLARDKPWSRFAAAVWAPADPELLARETGIADDAPGEATVGGWDTTFPHELATASDPVRAVLLTPYGDEMLTDVAIAALGGEHLGEDAAPDLLAIGYSSHDFASHLWGQGSWEQLELLLQLDRQLERLLDALDAKLGPSGYAVVLTSDHGATPIVETSRHRGARRVPVDNVELVAEQAMAKLLGAGDWVETISAMQVYMTPAFAAVDDARRRDDALEAAVDAIRMMPGVRDAGRLAPLAAGCPSGEDMARICKSYVEGESGDIYLVPVEGSLITEYTTGSHHDAPSIDNRVVPLIVRAPGVAARTSYQAVSMLQIAPTIARLLGAARPSGAQAPELELVPRPPAASAPAKNAE